MGVFEPWQVLSAPPPVSWESWLSPEPGLLLLSPQTGTLGMPFPTVLAAGQVTLKGLAIALGPTGLSVGSMPEPAWLSGSGDC